MGSFAFGTYRVVDKNPQHIEALKEAVEAGITLIDTSSNYMNGASERAIGDVLRSFDYDVRQRVEIITKYRLSQNFSKQLQLSLERLEVEYIDCYMIELPEEYILEGIEKGISRDDILDNLYERFYEAFVDFEKAVKDKKILSYGISSESFAQKPESKYFLPYEDLLDIAYRASKEVCNDNLHFSTISLPVNILEVEGIKCASWAKENSLRVVSSRPLNARYNSKMYRLASYDEPYGYYHALNELLDICDNDRLRSLYNLIQELDRTKHQFGWIEDYDRFFYTQVVEHIQKLIKGFDEKTTDVFLGYIDRFFDECRAMVLYECSKRTKKELEIFFEKCDFGMQKCAIDFLLGCDVIDYIAVGMRKPRYIHEILSLD